MKKTNRDIKSSLEVARKNRAPSFTQKIEEKMKAELEKEFGPILPEQKKSEIAEKEKEARAKQNLALNKSRMKILKMKEKAKTLQEARRGPIQIKPRNLKKKTKSSEESEKLSNFKKIDIGY